VTPFRVTCVIPALNAAPTLDAVVSGVRAALPANAVIVVVDDGSRDGTYDVARDIADVAIRLPENRGKGAALRAGFATALELGVEAVLTIDADGQHDPACAPALVDALITADLVVGARPRSRQMPAGRRLTNLLSAAAVSRCIGQPVPDAQCGFRAIRADVVANVNPHGDRYEFETGFLIIAARRGYRVAFVPVPTRYGAPVPSQFRSVRDSVRIVSTLWRFGAGASV